MSETETVSQDVIPKEAMPALYQHCVTVWEGMTERAEPLEENPDILVYEGYTTHLFEELGLSTPYYTKVMNMMKAMDSLRQMSRGGGSAQSQWALIQEPTVELFQEAMREEGKIVGKKQAKTTMLEQQLGDLRDRVSDLENQVATIQQRLDIELSAQEAPSLG